MLHDPEFLEYGDVCPRFHSLPAKISIPRIVQENITLKYLYMEWNSLPADLFPEYYNLKKVQGVHGRSSALSQFPSSEIKCTHFLIYI